MSLSEADWAFVNERVRSQGLRSRSEYFKLLVDQDKVFTPKTVRHTDGKLHFYEEIRAVAEHGALYGDAKPKLDEPKPPDDSDRDLGAGPAATISA